MGAEKHSMDPAQPGPIIPAGLAVLPAAAIASQVGAPGEWRRAAPATEPAEQGADDLSQHYHWGTGRALDPGVRKRVFDAGH